MLLTCLSLLAGGTVCLDASGRLACIDAAYTSVQAAVPACNTPCGAAICFSQMLPQPYPAQTPIGRRH